MARELGEQAAGSEGTEAVDDVKVVLPIESADSE